jgi:hypothetical protein
MAVEKLIPYAPKVGMGFGSIGPKFPDTTVHFDNGASVVQ